LKSAQSTELRAQSSGHRAQGTELRAQSSGLRAQGSGLRAQGSGRRAQGSELRAQGAGRRAQSTDIAGRIAQKHVSRSYSLPFSVSPVLPFIFFTPLRLKALTPIRIIP